MADGTHIEWTDATWNIVTGCSIVSPGCTNCYAMSLAGTRLRHHPSREGLTTDSKAGPVWNGKVRFNEQWLDQPLRWKKPRRIFVCAHGDLFHENVPDEWIDRVFAIMALAPQHTFQVLTKRATRMREYLWRLHRAVVKLQAERAGEHLDGPDLIDTHPQYAAAIAHPSVDWQSWPLPSVWLGVSVEDQPRAAERIPDLLATPAAKRFLSCEPLLGPIDLTLLDNDGPARPLGPAPECGDNIDALRGTLSRWPSFGAPAALGAHIDWVIAGGESGPNARPMHPAWALSLRDQCQAAGVPFFFKQWGSWGPIEHSEAADEAGWQGRGDWMILSHDGDLDIPDYRWPDEAAGEVAVVRVGKRAAGRLLDGLEWSEFPA